MSLITAALGIANALGVGETIGNWFGGNNGNEIADKIVKVTQAVTGTASITDTLQALQDPTIATQVKSDLMAHELEFSKLAFGDKKDAREMQETAIESKDRFVSRFLYYFSFYWAIVATAYLFAITFAKIPDDAIRFADTILGFLLGTIIAGIISFFYGASFKGSKPSLNGKS
ncbi:hypothetical protein [Vibrio sp. OPT18]|uniref:hypothetical protein n=1 Tax=Vibrio sp. OPT18 TaxID=2778641 RepID=UPI0018822A6D|nr:hypothetical protein [Vibrio sp. OPT18]MBE8578631.1 hypothetical protein [Vibrio sp. OPT18]